MIRGVILTNFEHAVNIIKYYSYITHEKLFVRHRFYEHTQHTHNGLCAEKLFATISTQTKCICQKLNGRPFEIRIQILVCSILCSLFSFRFKFTSPRTQTNAQRRMQAIVILNEHQMENIKLNELSFKYEFKMVCRSVPGIYFFVFVYVCVQIGYYFCDLTEQKLYNKECSCNRKPRATYHWSLGINIIRKEIKD